jgi:predicted ArsR family transcriptional regulator
MAKPWWSLRNRILCALQEHGPMTSEKVADLIGVNVKCVTQEMSDMRNQAGTLEAVGKEPTRTRPRIIYGALGDRVEPMQPRPAPSVRAAPQVMPRVSSIFELAEMCKRAVLAGNDNNYATGRAA